MYCNTKKKKRLGLSKVRMDCVQITNIFVKHWEMKERKILEILPLELAGLMVAGKKK